MTLEIRGVVCGVCHNVQTQFYLRKNTEMVQKSPTPLNAHVYRLFKLFDELYEFGASDYFEAFQGIGFGHRLFSDALKDLDHKAIQIGINRIKSLEYRKRVFPEPRHFYKLCVMSESEFLENKSLYEYRIYEYQAR